MTIAGVKYYRLGMLNEDGDIEYKAYTFQEQAMDANGNVLTGQTVAVDYVLYVAVNGSSISIVKEKHQLDISPIAGDEQSVWQDGNGNRYEKTSPAYAEIQVSEWVQKTNVVGGKYYKDAAGRTVIKYNNIYQYEDNNTQYTGDISALEKVLVEQINSLQGSFEKFFQEGNAIYYRRTGLNNVYAHALDENNNWRTDNKNRFIYVLDKTVSFELVKTGMIYLKYQYDTTDGSDNTKTETGALAYNDQLLLAKKNEFNAGQNDKRADLYYADGSQCEEYDIIYKDGSWHLIYTTGREFGTADLPNLTGTLTAQAQSVTKDLGTRYYATFVDDNYRQKHDYDPASKQSFIDPGKHSASSFVPVLRFGSAGNTIIFSGPIDNIGLKSVSLPKDTVVNETIRSAYKITDTLYLVKTGNGGLIVNIKKDNTGKVLFSSKFDGAVYTSTKLIASHLGKLAVERNLAGVNVNGEKIYLDSDKHVYVLTEDNLFYCKETNHTMTQAETLAILYEVPPTKNLTGPVITIRAGQQIMLERLTDHIAQDINKGTDTGSWNRYNGKFYYSKNGIDGWSEIKDVSFANGVLTVKYRDTNANKDVQMQISMKTLTDDTSRARIAEQIIYIQYPTFDTTGNVSYRFLRFLEILKMKISRIREENGCGEYPLK